MNSTDRLIDKLTRETMETYQDIETELIYRVAMLWADLDNKGGTIEHLIQVMNDMNVLNRDTLGIISKITGTPLSTLHKDLSLVGYHSIDYDVFSKALEVGAITHLPKNKLIDDVVARHITYLDENMKFIESQTKSGLFKQTFRAINKAQLEVELGVKSSNQAITDAVSDLARKGIQGDSYLRQGKEVHQNMEAVVRRAVRTSFNGMVNDLSEELAEDLGTEHYYVSQHLGARAKGLGMENHAKWQGKIYTTKEMETVCGEDDASNLGFGGYNCRHNKRPYFPGISVPPPPTLNMDELERVYELEQKQRLYERNIKTTKRQINALSVLDSQESIDKRKSLNKTLKKQQKRIREHIKQNEDVLKRDYSREKVIDV